MIRNRELGWPLLLAGFFSVLVVMATSLGLRNLTGDFWEGEALSKAGKIAEYCELNRFEWFIRQPVNSWSNAFYLFFGLWLLGIALQDGRSGVLNSGLRSSPVFTAWAGLMLAGLGAGSFYFHAGLTMTGQHWDMTFTYSVTLSSVIAGFYLLTRERFASAGAARILFMCLAVASPVLMYLLKWKMNAFIVLPSMMAVVLVLAFLFYRRNRTEASLPLMIAGIASIVISEICRELDLAKIGCAPESWFQLHAVWHFFTGLGGFLFILFFRGR